MTTLSPEQVKQVIARTPPSHPARSLSHDPVAALTAMIATGHVTEEHLAMHKAWLATNATPEDFV